MSQDLGSWSEAVQRRMRERAGKVIYALATDFQGEVKKDLSVPNPTGATPSAPGQFPRARTFNLRDAVVVDRTLAETIATGEVRVGVLKSAWYLLPLVRRLKRLGLADSYRKARPRLARLRKFLGG